MTLAPASALNRTRIPRGNRLYILLPRPRVQPIRLSLYSDPQLIYLRFASA